MFAWCHHAYRFGILPSTLLSPTAIVLQHPEAEWQIPHSSHKIFTHAAGSSLNNISNYHERVLINLAGSSYVTTTYYLIWDRSQLYPITWMILLLLHLTLALPWSHVIKTILS